MTRDPVEKAAEEIIAAPITIIESRTMSDAGLWESDLETGETVIDESLERMYGLEPGSFGGTYEEWAEFVHPDDLPKVEEIWESAIEDGEPYQVVFRIVRDDGVIRWIDSRARLITDETGEPIKMQGLNTDITESQERVQQLQVLDRVLRHNLRNDMSVIMGHAEMIAESASGPTAESAAKIVQMSEQLLEKSRKQQTISDLLSTKSKPGHVDLVSLVEEVTGSVREDHPEATVTLKLPEEAPVSVVDSFDAAIEEVLVNAIVHSDRESPYVEVDVTVDNDMVRLQVADDGPGIPEMDRQIVTGEQEISQLQHASGLGLWLISWVARRSGGTITFEENDPRGTILTIEIR